MDDDLLAAFGETVALLERAEAGRDAMNQPVWEERPVEVPGVLVNFGASALGDAARPTGQRTDAVLCFPVGFDRDVRGTDALVRGERYRIEWQRPAPRVSVVPYGVTAGAVRIDG